MGTKRARPEGSFAIWASPLNKTHQQQTTTAQSRMAPQEQTSAATVEMPPTTLASLMQNDLVPMATLVERHGSAATIAEVLLGIVPNKVPRGVATRKPHVLRDRAQLSQHAIVHVRPRGTEEPRQSRVVRLEPWGRLSVLHVAHVHVCDPPRSACEQAHAGSVVFARPDALYASGAERDRRGRAPRTHAEHADT